MDVQRTDRTSNRRIIVPRFSLSTILLSTSTIAIGCGGFGWFIRAAGDKNVNLDLARAVWLASGALVAAGVFAIFDRPVLGAIIGFALQYALILLAHGFIFPNS
jgi:hypothetical protein